MIRPQGNRRFKSSRVEGFKGEKGEKVKRSLAGRWRSRLGFGARGCGFEIGDLREDGATQFGLLAFAALRPRVACWQPWAIGRGPFGAYGGGRAPDQRMAEEDLRLEI